MQQAALRRAGCVAALGLAGCAGGGARADLIQVSLAAIRINAGETGRANLVAVGDRTEVAVTVSGVPPDLSSRPVHLYTFLFPGTCANPGSAPAYALTRNVLAQVPGSMAVVPIGGPFKVSNEVPAPLATVARGPFALRIYTSPADGNREIFCGDVGG